MSEHCQYCNKKVNNLKSHNKSQKHKKNIIECEKDQNRIAILNRLCDQIADFSNNDVITKILKG
jgi:hypothetical protein